MGNTLDLPAIAKDPDRLNRLSLAELRALWGRCCPKAPPSPHRGILMRELAFVAQSGGARLHRETDTLIRAAIKAASVTRSPNDGGLRKRIKPSSPPAARELPPGAVLVREWGQQTHEVTVLGGGWFLYNDQNYKSLTLVAKAITGAHWSGPRFFGLHGCREPAHD